MIVALQEYNDLANIFYLCYLNNKSTALLFMASRLKRFPINIVLFGPPGVGKGVYCNLLERDLGIKAFSTGDYSRHVLQSKEHPSFTKEELIEIEKKVAQGELLSDDIVTRMIQPQLIEARKSGLMFDGFPRTLSQAKFLNENLPLNIVFNLNLREDILVRKLLGRRVCPECKRSFNIENVNEGEYVMPPMLPKHGDPKWCDICTHSTSGQKVELITRKDDTRDVIVRRQEIY